MDHGTVLETPVLHSWLLWSIGHHDGNGNNFARAAILNVHFFVHFFAGTARTECTIQPKRENPGNEVAWNYLAGRRFMEDVNISGGTFFFLPLNLSSVAKNSIPEKFTCIWHFKQIEIIAADFKPEDFLIVTLSLRSPSLLLKLPNRAVMKELLVRCFLIGHRKQ